MKKVLITGSNGVIGTVLKRDLHYVITDFDFPGHDARDYDQLVKTLKGQDAIIHLAWNTKDDNFRSDFHHPDNALKAIQCV